jgi:mRNA interferase MazF
VWTAAGSGYAGKPRPVLIVQADLYRETASVTICGFTTDQTETGFLRPLIMPTASNGLRIACRLMTDKVTTVPRTRLGARIGRLSDDDMMVADRALLVFLGLAG